MITFARILLRQARQANPDDPAAWLIDLQTAQFGAVQSGGQVTGTSASGKSVTISILPGMSKADLLLATELALQALERGLDGPVRETKVRFL